MQSPGLTTACAAACAAFGLDTTGNAETLAQRIGVHIAERLFADVATSVPATPHSERKRPCEKRPREGEKRPLTEKARAWHAFAKRERPLVKQAGITGKADVLKEVAARYKRFRLVGTPDQPLLLAPPSDTEDADAEDGLLAAIRELSPDEVSEALEAQGVAATDDPMRNASLLVDALMA